MQEIVVQKPDYFSELYKSENYETKHLLQKLRLLKYKRRVYKTVDNRRCKMKNMKVRVPEKELMIERCTQE